MADISLLWHWFAMLPVGARQRRISGQTTSGLCII